MSELDYWTNFFINDSDSIILFGLLYLVGSVVISTILIFMDRWSSKGE